MDPGTRRSGARVGRGLRFVGLVCLFAALAGCAAEPEPASPSEAHDGTVILISLDGTRPQDVTPTDMPKLAGLAAQGTGVLPMQPAIPSNTFPNHVTMATGVAPETHGIVNNYFVDPERGVFRKQDIPEWIEVEPIWSLLDKAGVRSASYYWVGSEGPWRNGRGPADWKPFSSKTTESEKVDQILEWMDRPVSERPRLITSWFHGGDRAGHRFGPGSEAVRRDLAHQDVEIGRLVEGLESRGLLETTTLIFVSDHGMTTADREVDLGTALREEDGLDAKVYGIGGFATVVLPKDTPDRAKARAQVVARAEALGLEAFDRAGAPAEARVDNVRFGDVVVRAPIGTSISYPGLDVQGLHGYAPETEEMAAFFAAIGPGVEAGEALPALHSVDVAPTVMAILGVAPPPWMEGRVVEAVLPPHSASSLKE